jgi:hypothetical protein
MKIGQFSPSFRSMILRFAVVSSHAQMTRTRIPLTPNQVRGFWAAWGGWVLDGMDSFIYALVLVPALRDSWLDGEWPCCGVRSPTDLGACAP